MTGASSPPVAHRLIVVYLTLPLIVWLLGWFEWWFGVPAALLAVWGVWPALSGSWRLSGALPLRAVLVLAAIALAWTMSTAAGGVLDLANGDWFKHRALLADLSAAPWPPFLSDEGTEILRGRGSLRDPLLRYYLGYYMVPALAAKWFGPGALAVAVPLWTWIGVALLVVSFASSVASSTGKAVAAAVILVFFSGMDTVRWLLLDSSGWDIVSFWSIEADHVFRVATQYTSSMFALMWVPQHFIAAGLGAVLLLESRRRESLPAAMGVVCAAIGFWSMFAAAGLVPLLAVLLFEKGPRPFLRWQNLIAAPFLAALLALYLTSDSADVLHGWLWRFWPWDVLAKWLPLFVTVEFLALAAALLLLRPRNARDPFFVASTATLLVLPMYLLGQHNDLTQRASQPLLLVLCWCTARSLFDRTAGGRPRTRLASPPPRILVIAILVVGALAPLTELVRAGSHRDADLVDDAQKNTAREAYLNLPQQYVAYEIPRMLRVILKDQVILKDLAAP